MSELPQERSSQETTVKASTRTLEAPLGTLVITGLFLLATAILWADMYVRALGVM